MKHPYKHYRILLGSKSPRRKQIISDLGLDFEIVDIHADEDFPDTLQPEWVAPFLAEKKSFCFESEIKKNEILLTADTVVILDNKVLNKPRDTREAREMLNKLSGKEHKVVTGVCMRNLNKKEVFADVSTVQFNALSDDDISYYIETSHPFDKAGSYGIQDWIGLSHIQSVKGSYFNIVGLPSHRIIESLKKW